MNKNIWIPVMMIMLLGGCVDPYNPDIDDSQQLLVINGTLTDQEGYHSVHISRSGPYRSKESMPVQDGTVEILDGAGRSVQFYESEPGLYEQWINQEFLQTGNKYKLRVTVNGTIYESGYETMLPCPPVQEVYYQIEKKGTADPANDIYGIQFYTEIALKSSSAQNYRWELEESWEYHSAYPIQNYWSGREMISLDYESYTLFYCWRSDLIPEIYTVTTRGVSGDTLSRIPLQFVSNETSRLTVKYSLLVKQYSLSDSAYYYWNQMQKLNQEAGELYETQPPQIRGNMFNIHDDKEIVLGNFNVSGKSEKRIFVSEKFDFFPEENCCVPVEYQWIPLLNLPIYFIGDPANRIVVNRECVDCTLLGGATEKPDFWK